MDANEMVEVEVWVLIDADGLAVSDCLPEHLKDEYEADHGQELDPSTPTRIVKVTLRVPLPKAVEMTGTVPEEVTTGSELRVA